MSGQASESKPPEISYGIDIGTYRHRGDGILRANTTFAWARAESNVRLLRVPPQDGHEFRFEGDFVVGRDIRVLATLIQADILGGRRIAIGIEAPMWQPGPTEIPDGAFDLFPIRFQHEIGFAWYLQSGASALARAISTGRLLFSLLNDPPADLRCSTIPSPLANVELFEGFVAGRWKLNAAEELPEGPHAWDALTAAVAFHYARRGEIAMIHPAGSFNGPVISHWHTICQLSNLNGDSCRRDCMVVGFDSEGGA